MTSALPKQSCATATTSSPRMHLARGYGTSSPLLLRWSAKMLPSNFPPWKATACNVNILHFLSQNMLTLYR
jgi:hypothetical protein